MVGDVIRKLRRARALSQFNLGNMCDINTMKLCHFESGARKPTLEELARIAPCLGVNVLFFIQHANDDDPDLTAVDLADCLQHSPQQMKLIRKIRNFSPEKMGILLSVADALAKHGSGKLNCVIVEEERGIER